MSHKIVLSNLGKKESLAVATSLQMKWHNIRRAYSILTESYLIIEADETPEVPIDIDNTNEFTIAFIFPETKATAFKKAIGDKMNDLVTKELIIDPAPAETDNTIEYSFISARPEVTIESLEKTFRAIDDELVVKVFGDIKGDTTSVIGKVVSIDTGDYKGQLGTIESKDDKENTYSIKLESGDLINLNHGEFTMHHLDLSTDV